MTDEDRPPRVSPDHVAKIVSSYVREHQVPFDQLAALIIEVHRALAGVGRPNGGKPPRPAVPIRRSVHRDYVVCLECGFHAQTLRRHLRVIHGLTAADYLIRWQLPDNYLLIAPAYSMRRSRFKGTARAYLPFDEHEQCALRATILKPPVLAPVDLHELADAIAPGAGLMNALSPLLAIEPQPSLDHPQPQCLTTERDPMNLAQLLGRQRRSEIPVPLADDRQHRFP